jgi:hypothetical protein
MKSTGRKLTVSPGQALANILHRGEVGALIREAIALLLDTGDLPNTQLYLAEEEPLDPGDRELAELPRSVVQRQLLRSRKQSRVGWPLANQG